MDQLDLQKYLKNTGPTSSCPTSSESTCDVYLWAHRRGGRAAHARGGYANG
jgi:hypothetical protein